MIKVTPDEAHGWLGFLNRLSKTKFGAGVIGFTSAALIAGVIFHFIINPNTKELNERIKKKNEEISSHSRELKEAIEEEKRNCVNSYREYYQLFIEQQNAVIQNTNNRVQLDEVKVLTEQNRELLNELKKYKQ